MRQRELARVDEHAALSLPSAVRTSCIAISDPSASPSGFSCATTTNFARGAQLVEHLLDADDGRVFIVHALVCSAHRRSSIKLGP